MVLLLLPIGTSVWILAILIFYCLSGVTLLPSSSQRRQLIFVNDRIGCQVQISNSCLGTRDPGVDDFFGSAHVVNG